MMCESRLLALASGLLGLLLVNPAGAAPKTYFESDGYAASGPMPLKVHGVPVGAGMTVAVRLPENYDPKGVPLSVLRLLVDDVDSPAEASIHVNGHGPMKLPESLLGEGAGPDGSGRIGFMRLAPGLLKPGANELKFVFEDNLKGSTKGFDVLEAVIALVRLDGKTQDLPMIDRDFYLEVPDFGTLAVYDSSLEPRRIRLRRDEDPSGWKSHVVRKGDGKGGWTCQQGEFQFLHTSYAKWLMPFGLAQMDNGEVILAGSWHDGRTSRIVVAFSKDRGDTWSDFQNVPGGYGRPTMLASSGKGRLTFFTGTRYLSADYGRTWPERHKVQPPSNGGPVYQEGNPLVETGPDGTAVRMAELLCNFGPPGTKWKPENPTVEFMRWSTDGGRSWFNETSPEAWRWREEYEGKTYTRSVSEGSLVRAKNGWLVAALRTDMPAKFFKLLFDHGEGVGTSISKDDGKIWSPVKKIFPAGRMHAHFVRMPNGDIVMPYIMRQDIADDLTYASYLRGCEAVVSRDNGQTWDRAGKYVLDAWQFVNAQEGPTTLVCGHCCSALLDNGQILTAYGHYASKGIAMVRWKP